MRSSAGRPGFAFYRFLIPGWPVERWERLTPRIRAPDGRPRFVGNASVNKGGWMAKSKSKGKKKKKAETVFLVCEETGEYNYILRRKPGGEKLRLKKYCPRLRKHTWHTEKKK